MADSWIKVEYATLEKIEIAKLASALGMDPYAVMGRLIRIWSYFDNSQNVVGLAQCCKRRRPALEPFYAPKRLSYVPSTATFAFRFCTS